MNDLKNAIADRIISEIILQDYMLELSNRDAKLRTHLLVWLDHAFNEALLRREANMAPAQHTLFC